MTDSPLAVYVGKNAAREIAAHGWEPDLFSLLLGASGGPKFFALSQLDRYLFGTYLAQRKQPITALGSSVGAWRHGCLGQADPAAAVARLEHSYLHQAYSAKPDVSEISQRSAETLQHMLGRSGAGEIIDNTRVHSHIVTARGRGITASGKAPLLGTGMGVAALTNAASRTLLRTWFQRVVFHSGTQPQEVLPLEGFATDYTGLTQDNLDVALIASGAIPFVLEGQRDIAGAPPGKYWDGGIIDYHFDLARFKGKGLILYPHFRADLTAGWFDKFLPWRRQQPHGLDDLVMLCPSDNFIADLPFRKIPDRKDFSRLDHDSRVAYWSEVIQRCAGLPAAFQRLQRQANPLAGVHLLN